MIESYLKMSHSCIFYLSISASYTSSRDKFGSIVRISLLTILIIWPFFVTAFLFMKRSQLETESFRRKFISMYSGLKTKKAGALLYTFIFCSRRMLLVLALLMLQGGDIWLILSFNALQSLYLWYVIYQRPHEGHIHNQLEYFNELCLVAMQYAMVFFIPLGGLTDPEFQWKVGNYAVAILGIIFAVNILSLIYITVRKIKFWLRVKKVRKDRKLMFQSKLAMKKLSSPETARGLKKPLDEARNMSAIMEEYSERSDVSKYQLPKDDSISDGAIEPVDLISRDQKAK